MDIFFSYSRADKKEAEQFCKAFFKFIMAVALSLLPVNSPAQGHRGKGEPKLEKGLMELPAIQGSDVILVYNGFIVNYNTERLIPNWVAYELTAEEVVGEVPRKRSFYMDLDYKGRQAMREDYSNTGWDKGHMAPAGDMKWSQAAMNDCFFLTNICPQNHELNGKDWHYLEQRIRGWATKYGSVWVVCGPIVRENLYGTIGERKVTIPDAFFKAVLRKEGRDWHSIGFVFQNNAERQSIREAVVSVNDIEALSGYDLFTNLSRWIEESVESQANWDDWKN